MNLEQLKEQWVKDCEIDDIELDTASLHVPKLHAKYSDLLTSKILLLKKYNQDYNQLLKYKWMWFNGKLDDDKIQELGWQTDPFDGLKIMKNDFNYFFNADEDLVKLKAKIDYLEVTVDFIKRCMDNITWRHQTIKNTIEWRKFMAGQ
jgi:hypothetical protein|tara:strand:- start:7458 stop:7901 length:444 start_codon:yes stop_codon:yes gene_type:complete